MAQAEERGLSAAVEKAFTGVKGAPEVTWLRDVDGLDDSTKKRMRRGGAQTKGLVSKGLYDPVENRVYLFTSGIRDETDAVWVAMHEIAGHRGIRGIFADGERGPDARRRIDEALEIAGQNDTIALLAERIREVRTMLNETQAIEEELGAL